MKHLLLLIFSSSLLFAQAPQFQSVESPAIVEVGGRKIAIPAPEGEFVRCDGANPDWDKTTAEMLPKTNRMLVTYGNQADLDALRAGKSTPYDRNFNVQIMRNLEREEFGTATFRSYRTSYRKEIEGLSANMEKLVNDPMKEGSRKLSGENGVDVALSVSDSAMLGIFRDDDQTLGFTMAMKMNLSENHVAASSRKIVVACLMEPVNGRLLMLYATAPYQNDSDRKWVESAVKQWGEAIFAANPQQKGPTRRGILDGAGRTALIGAVLGGLIGGIAALAKRKKAQT